MKTVKVGLLGLGTVGNGTHTILRRNGEEITTKCGRIIRITHIADKCIAKLPNKAPDVIYTTEVMDVINNPEIDIIIELIGGLEPARTFISQAINKGKHVITANKALIATHGNELFKQAKENKVIIAYEAAIAGGIPIVKALREGLAGNKIEWIAGIINGTGNFILTEMRDKQRQFDDVLKEAQALGYAEADPTYDIEGIDAAHKLTILASISFGIALQLDKVYTEGITKITPQDVLYAKELGYQIKHLGITKKTEQGIEMRVHPTLIPHKRLIANVDGVMNAIVVKADALGPTLYYGAGAGAEPTGSAVVADLIDIARNLESPEHSKVPMLGFQTVNSTPVLSMESITSAYYLRLHVIDKPGVLADITVIFAKHHISIEVIIQKDLAISNKNDNIPLILMTHITSEKQMQLAKSQIEALSSIITPTLLLRIENLS